MSFRARLLVAFVLLGLFPLTFFALGIRDEMTDRLTEQDDRRVAALVALIEDDLRERSLSVAERMGALGEEMRDDNRLRRALAASREGPEEGELVDGDRADAGRGADATERAYLLDYGGEAMRMTGLSMLQIQDGTGRILSSGHFRNEYDRREPALARTVGVAPDAMALVPARSPAGPFLALVRGDSFRIGDERIVLVGGLRIGPAFLERLSRGHELGVSLEYPGGVLGSEPGAGQDADREVVGEVPLAFVSDAAPPAEVPDERSAEAARPDAPVEAGAAGGEELAETDAAGRPQVAPDAARFVITRSSGALRTLRRSVDIWFLVAVALTAAAALALAAWLSRRLSRPLAELAARTDRLDLDRLDVDFATDRADEVGTLSRVLDRMTERLRHSTTELREAERRATVGEMARQVNHDIRNGLTPIRNVIRHLTRIAWDAPERLSRTFLERRDSLDNSIDYLETLATNYARLTPEREAVRCDVNAVVQRVLGQTRSPGWVRITTKLDGELPRVAADPVALQRVLQNLLSNALQSLEGNGGTVSVLTGRGPEAVEMTVADTGRGIEPGERERIFEDFYTTREEGTGLGLSIVRRLVSDMDGRIRVESRPGLGSRFIVELPVASDAEENAGAEEEA